jgi:hypothetical protein
MTSEILITLTQFFFSLVYLSRCRFLPLSPSLNLFVASPVRAGPAVAAENNKRKVYPADTAGLATNARALSPSLHHSACFPSLLSLSTTSWGSSHIPYTDGRVRWVCYSFRCGVVGSGSSMTRILGSANSAASPWSLASFPPLSPPCSLAWPLVMIMLTL